MVAMPGGVGVVDAPSASAVLAMSESIDFRSSTPLSQRRESTRGRYLHLRRLGLIRKGLGIQVLGNEVPQLWYAQ